MHKTLIAMGYKSELNAAALIVGPTGLACDEDADVLYVASMDDNAIFAIPHAGHRTSPVNKGNPIFSDPHLRGPLALVFVPNGHLLTANGDAVTTAIQPIPIVEFAKDGEFVGEFWTQVRRRVWPCQLGLLLYVRHG